MTRYEKLHNLAILVEDSDANQELLSIYLDIAKTIILNKAFPFGNQPEDVPSKYENIQLNVACYLYNKRGAEGEVVHNENGISRTYESADVPDSMLSGITPYAGVPSWEH